MNAARPDHRSLPRRRGDALLTAIFDATLAELSDSGYARLSMERIAARARTGKASIYRRWPTRAELVGAALGHVVADRPHSVPDTGGLRGDLLAVLRAAADRLEGPFGEATRGLFAETMADPEATRRAREGMIAARDRVLSTVIARAVERGEAGAHALHPRLTGLGPTLLTQHFLLDGVPIGDEVIEEILDLVVLPLLAPR
ncbi:TetR/AcrR family transcriptional regulator [Nocardia sp. CDC159]|uniref:TetR/AcrR family transcriptional regulator n=1 Tax=Nocardia pulmonis TaxID=2951408 RepID=A0A9X2IVN1_9NOCA|nr:MULTISPECIES: TetR/AcrR family transcriptional regulator [Nocardia]MCM6772659.1 TetR/AcrR family transcriptional regulator [Nocardia pulmonis]MCM6786038.1 TetR/AcrR family transcriptional regulator [Nocardia sp. CDC159]